MKNKFIWALSIIGLLFVACDKDDDHHDECHECHVLCALDDGTTHEHEIGEFCGEDLHEVEENGYTLSEEMTIMGVTYPAGHTFAPADLCCEEHADH